MTGKIQQALGMLALAAAALLVALIAGPVDIVRDSALFVAAMCGLLGLGTLGFALARSRSD